MKFYGNGLVWDKERNKALCKFTSGEFITDDTNIIEKLKKLNFDFDDINNESEKTDNDNVDYSALSYQELKKIAKEKGIKLERSMKQEDILNELMKV